MKVLKRNGRALQHAKYEFRTDPEVAWVAFEEPRFTNDYLPIISISDSYATCHRKLLTPSLIAEN